MAVSFGTTGCNVQKLLLEHAEGVRNLFIVLYG
jgi:hypothetical protein